MARSLMILGSQVPSIAMLVVHRVPPLHPAKSSQAQPYYWFQIVCHSSLISGSRMEGFPVTLSFWTVGSVVVVL